MTNERLTDGNEIHIIGKGNGPTRIVKNGEIVYEGTYNQCVAYCNERGITYPGGRKFPHA